MVARLAADVGVDQARAELDSMLIGWRERSGEQHSPNPEGHPMIVTALHQNEPPMSAREAFDGMCATRAAPIVLLRQFLVAKGLSRAALMGGVFVVC